MKGDVNIEDFKLKREVKIKQMKWTIYNILFRFLVELWLDPFWALGDTCYVH